MLQSTGYAGPMSRQSYAQHLLKLGLPIGDPIVEVAIIWARGDRATTRQIEYAIMSAERWRQGKDKLMRQRMGGVINRLTKYLEYSRGATGKPYRPGTLVTEAQYRAGVIPGRNPKRKRKAGKQAPRVSRGHVTYSGHGVHQDKRRRALDRISKRELRDNCRNPKRGSYFVHDPYLGQFLDFGSVKTAARFARNRFGCEPAGDCVFVEQDEALIPLGTLKGAAKTRSNPYPYEHAARLIDPRKMVKTSFRRKNVKNGTIGLIMGKRVRTGPMTLQAVRFRAAHFSPAEAKAWLKKHKLKPILFEPATKSRKSAWKAEGARRKRSGRGRRRKAA